MQLRTTANVRVLVMSLVGAALVAFPSGCATVLHGTTQSIAVNTQPSGASVLVDDRMEYTSPCQIPLARKIDHHVQIEMPGYEREEYQIVRVPTGKAVNNLWVGGLIGLGVDAATGADNKLVPEVINVSLRRSSGTPDASTLTLSDPRRSP